MLDRLQTWWAQLNDDEKPGLITLACIAAGVLFLATGIVVGGALGTLA